VPYSPIGSPLAATVLYIREQLAGVRPLIQRLFTEIILLHHGTAQLETPAAGPIIPEITGTVLGLFILAGLWTPSVGALVAAVELWIALVAGSDIWISLMLAVLGSTLALIGPGAWSIDARLFRRKHSLRLRPPKVGPEDKRWNE